MSNILIINAHHKYPFAEGRLNGTLTQMADELLRAKGHETRVVEIDAGWDVEKELENHQWADVVILQTPINWMGVPWTFKKYMDEVYTAGMGGALCNGDGRTAEAPKENYGAGGTLTGRKYMMSVTFNAPEESFNDENEYLFQGKSVDDLLFPMHMNFRFFGMDALPTFACYDVMKNADVENDFDRFRAHLEASF
ncbi:MULTISPECIES: NAD(P)H-dependent oxidoreductase [Marinobacter]|uniref:NAD(P)H-dependent oxidoreductase n=1 Tax=Marinobacter TaxID=2742 RepID=UPI001D083435|nr:MULTISPECIES: NAD(P)H-dependent oxidoreductase [Marinobacter]MCK7569015.1 NAD(P)H-dependent oxidoreductase [Marinobacter xestospongiae]UDL07013.1 NAD(P)H-dependent oxidoreductase [Marinobacter sp. CA1]